MFLMACWQSSRWQVFLFEVIIIMISVKSLIHISSFGTQELPVLKNPTLTVTTAGVKMTHLVGLHKSPKSLLATVKIIVMFVGKV